MITRGKHEKLTNTWRLNNLLQNNQWVKGEIKREIKIILRQIKTQDEAQKMMLRGKVIVINAYTKNKELK